MNGTPARIDLDDGAAARAANAVLDLQQRLAAEFGPARDDPSGLPGATGPFERMLCEILTSIGWQGEQRKLLEALPHLEPMRSPRATLSRSTAEPSRVRAARPYRLAAQKTEVPVRSRPE